MISKWELNHASWAQFALVFLLHKSIYLFHFSFYLYPYLVAILQLDKNENWNKKEIGIKILRNCRSQNWRVSLSDLSKLQIWWLGPGYMNYFLLW